MDIATIIQTTAAVLGCAGFLGGGAVAVIKTIARLARIADAAERGGKKLEEFGRTLQDVGKQLTAVGVQVNDHEDRLKRRGL